MSDEFQRYLDQSQGDEITDVEALLRSTSSAARISAGNLSHRSFGELLAELYRWKSTGALILRRGQAKKVVYFRDGRPVFVKSNLVSECLGRILIREKFISEADCEESLRRLRESGRPQGTVLIEMGSISPHNLVYALQLQLQTKILDVFRWPDGTYQFDSRTKAPDEPSSLEMTTAAVIYEGIKRAYGEERVAAEVGNVNKLYPVPSPDPLYRFQEIGLEPEEATLLASVDGSKSVAEIAIDSVLSPTAALRFLLAMKTAQVIEFHDEPSHEPLPLEIREQLAPTKAAGSPSPKPDLPRVPPRPPPRAQAERLLAKAAELRTKSHFEVLGVGSDADPERIRTAYLALAREYHPDKHYSAVSAQVRELAAEIYGRIITAYEVLSDPVERAEYLELQQTLRKPRADASPDPIVNILAAEGKFERGRELFDARRLHEAMEQFREAVHLYPDEGEFRAWLGWTIYSAKPRDPAATTAALEALEAAIRQSPGLECGYLFLGRIYKAQGLVDRAEREFERALKSNRDSAEALRELRELSRR